jgi:hypothetical protein
MRKLPTLLVLLPIIATTASAQPGPGWIGGDDVKTDCIGPCPPSYPVVQSPLVFVWNDEKKVGGCRTLPGARLELSAAPNGYVLHYVAQMDTSWTLMGNIWHVTWKFYDAGGRLVLVSKQSDFPEGGGRLHSQFGTYYIDHTQLVGPDHEPQISTNLSRIHSVKSVNSC